MRTNYTLRMFIDIAVIGLPLFAIGVSGKEPVLLWISLGILFIGFLGFYISLFQYLNDKTLPESAIFKDISMAATYVWPCILSGLITYYFGYEGWLFYVLAAFALCIILILNHCGLLDNRN